MKEKRLLIVLFAALLVFSLFGCGKKEDAPAADLDIPASDEDTVDSGIASAETTVGKTVLTGRELEDLFIFGYDTEKFSRENLYQDQYAFYCDKYPKRSTGTQADAIAYGWVENEMSNSKYKDKELPDDGFEQYVAWRQAYENTPPSSDTAQEPEDSNEITGIPDENNQGGFNGYDDPSLIDQDSKNVYEGATIRGIPEHSQGDTKTVEKDYSDSDPSYSITG